MRIQNPCVVAIVLAVTFGTVSLQAADWPTYQADARRSGATSEQLAPPLAAQWVFVSPHPPARGWPETEIGPIQDDWHWGKYLAGYNTKDLPLVSKVRFDDAFQVAAAGDAVYFASSAENRVFALDAASGKIRWVFFTGAPTRLAPTVWEGKVYFGSDDGYAYCLNAADGKEIWKRRAGPSNEMMLGHGRMMSHWPVRTSVLVDNGIAYFGAGLYSAEKLYLLAVNANDGNIVWVNSTYARGGRANITPQGYLLASKERVVMPSGRVAPAIFYRKNGRLEWVVDRGGGLNGGGYAMLSKEGNILYNGTQRLKAFDLITKRRNVQWNKPLSNRIFVWYRARRILVDQGTAYLVTNAEMLALPMAKISEAAKQAEGTQQARYDNRRNKAKIAAADKKLNEYLDGTCMWRLSCETPDSFIRAGSILYAGGKEQVVAVDAKSGKKLWEEKVDGIARGLAVANGRLFVSTTTGRIHCFIPVTGGAAGKAKKIEPPANDTPYPKDKLTAFYARMAKQIVDETGITRGYCLILGGGTGRLAHELAKLTELNIYVAEPDAKKVAEARKALTQARLYGARVCVDRTGLENLPYSPYFANLVIAEEAFLGGKLSTPPAELLRVVRPLGGVALVGQPSAARKLGKAIDASQLTSVLKELESMNAKVSSKGTWAKVTRGALEGASSWSHYYATPGNTGCSEDQLAEAPFRVLWVGDPGPRNMLSRHTGPPTPLSVNGRIFIGGADIIMCYDAYNGLHLWDRKVPKVARRGLGEQSGHMAATPEGLFVVVKEKCLHLDPATGELKTTYYPPKHRDGKPRCWGWIATENGLLFGTRTYADPAIPWSHWQKKRGYVSQMLFAIDLATGKTLWTYDGKDIMNLSIAAGDGTIFFLDHTVTEEQRRQATENQTEKAARVDNRGNPVKAEVRLAVALDARTGEKRWSKPLDVSTCVLDPKKKQVVLKYANNVLLVCASYPDNKNPGPSTIALAGDTGKVLWTGMAGYRYRAIIVGDSIYAAPWVFDLRTGAQRRRGGKNWQLPPGYKCSGPIASAKTLFFRTAPWGHGGMGMYNVPNGKKVFSFGGQKPGCTSNMITANGLLLIPDGTAHCTCEYAIQGSVALYPRPRE